MPRPGPRTASSSSWPPVVIGRSSYIPLASLSPHKIKQLRILHILSGKDKRDLAGAYIW